MDARIADSSATSNSTLSPVVVNAPCCIEIQQLKTLQLLIKGLDPCILGPDMPAIRIEVE
jgi:hypothetical protein